MTLVPYTPITSPHIIAGGVTADLAASTLTTVPVAHCPQTLIVIYYVKVRLGDDILARL